MLLRKWQPLSAFAASLLPPRIPCLFPAHIPALLPAPALCPFAASPVPSNSRRPLPSLQGSATSAPKSSPAFFSTESMRSANLSVAGLLAQTSPGLTSQVDSPLVSPAMPDFLTTCKLFYSRLSSISLLCTPVFSVLSSNAAIVKHEQHTNRIPQSIARFLLHDIWLQISSRQRWLFDMYRSQNYFLTFPFLVCVCVLVRTYLDCPVKMDPFYLVVLTWRKYQGWIPLKVSRSSESEPSGE